jgi:hypothetical protein
MSFITKAEKPTEVSKKKGSKGIFKDIEPDRLAIECRIYLRLRFNTGDCRG